MLNSNQQLAKMNVEIGFSFLSTKSNGFFV